MPCISIANTVDYLGQKKIEDLKGYLVEYNGEILDGDKATGFGEYTDRFGAKYSGHFVDE